MKGNKYYKNSNLENYWIKLGFRKMAVFVINCYNCYFSQFKNVHGRNRSEKLELNKINSL